MDRQAQEASWWHAWWQADLSWDGLTRHDGHPAATLQDYWRNEADRLIAEPGTARQWTRFHCPFVFADGTPSPKTRWTESDWADLHLSLRTRLARGTQFKPTLLGGIVVDGLFEAADEVPDLDGFLWLRAEQAYFRDGIDLSRNGLGLADFRGAWFGGKVVLEGTRAITVQFDEALFAARMPREPERAIAAPAGQPQILPSGDVAPSPPPQSQPQLQARSKALPARLVAACLLIGALGSVLWFLAQQL